MVKIQFIDKNSKAPHYLKQGCVDCVKSNSFWLNSQNKLELLSPVNTFTTIIETSTNTVNILIFEKFHSAW